MIDLRSLDHTVTYVMDMLIDIRYADDMILISAIFDKLQLSTAELKNACTRWGMKINIDKCKVLSQNDRPIHIEGVTVENLENFVFLGSVVPDTGEDILRRTALTFTSFGRLRRSVWCRKEVSLLFNIIDKMQLSH